MTGWKEDINLPLLASLGLLGTAILIVTILLTEAAHAKVKRGNLQRHYDEQSTVASFYQQVYDPQVQRLKEKKPNSLDESVWAIPVETAKGVVAKSKGKVQFAAPPQ